MTPPRACPVSSSTWTGTAHDLTASYAYDPADQIVVTTRLNDLYAFTAHQSGTVA